MAALNLDAVSAALKLSADDAPWRARWAETQAALPAGLPDHLASPHVSGACDWIGMAPEIREALLSVLHRFSEQPALVALSWHLRLRLFGPDPYAPAELALPVIGSLSENEAGLVHAVTLLAGLQFAQKFYHDHAIPESVLKATLADMELWIRDYKTKHGGWGFKAFNWLVRHLRGRLFRLGRLQFEMARFPLDFAAFRNRQDNRVMVLCNSGMRFRPDGQYADADGRAEMQQAWEASLTRSGDWIEGFPVSPLGRALRAPVKLSLKEWERVLAKDDPILSVHIPATGPMDFAACGESFRAAIDFFPRHFPRMGAKGFYCCSWLLDPQLEACLPPETNIVKFLREFYLVPVPAADSKQIFERVFNVIPSAPDSLPQTTSLQRAIVAKLKAGWSFRSGGMVAFFGRDFDWGKSVYRSAG